MRRFLLPLAILLPALIAAAAVGADFPPPTENVSNSRLALIALEAEAPQAGSSRQPSSTEFVRYITDRSGGPMLETAEVTYRNPEGVCVTLIGAVHIADPAYFTGLNASFDHYDALLYEMVKPKDPPQSGRATTRRDQGMLGWVGPIQRFMRDHLDLAYQLEGINYENRPNFVHADLDLDTFLALQKERDESLGRLMIRAYKSEFSRRKRGEKTASSELTPFHLLAAIKAGPDRTRQLKILLARQLGDLEGQLAMLEGPNGSVIISERNRRAFEVLDEQIASGKRNLGIFYGAGHFPDMERRLRERGFEKVGQTWRTAWDMRSTPATHPATAPAD